jgi:hypothetical protein
LRPGLAVRSHQAITGGRQLGGLSLGCPHFIVESFAASPDLDASLAELAARPRQLGSRAGHADLIDAERFEGLTTAQERGAASGEPGLDVLQEDGVRGLALASVTECSKLVGSFGFE